MLFQKILRHAKKLPEKSLHFYKELNRLKRAALYIGFYELLEGCAAIFDRGKNQTTDLNSYCDHENYPRSLSNIDMKCLWYFSECALLSSGSQGGIPHPDCAIQLRHAASELRSRAVLNIDYQITPLQN